jgi:hypothetical protein
MEAYYKFSYFNSQNLLYQLMDDCNLDYIKQNWEREREREREGGTEVPGSLDSCFTPNIMEVTG